MLELKNIQGGYYNHKNILNTINFKINKGEVVALLGQNGSGKSTLIKAIVNDLEIRKGNVYWDNIDISNTYTHLMQQNGIAVFKQGGEVFLNLTIEENLKLITKEIFVFLNSSSFAILKQYKNKAAGILSGGERNLLALAMALAHKPKLLILDEPTAGLSPIASKKIYEVLNDFKKEGLTILLIEQNIKSAIEFADRVAIIQNGKIGIEIENTKSNKTIKQVEKLFFE